MHRTLARLSHLAARFFAGGAAASMFFLFLIVFINSVRRYSFGKSLEWGEELPVYLAIYGVMFGIAWAYLEDRHIRFTILVGFLPESVTRKVYLLVDLVMIGTGAMVGYSGWLFVIKRGAMESTGMINFAKELRAATGWEPMIWLGHFYPYQAAIMAGGLMLTLAAVLRFSMRLAETLRSEPVAG